MDGAGGAGAVSRRAVRVTGGERLPPGRILDRLRPTDSRRAPSAIAMRKPVVGIIANSFMINDQYPAQISGTMNVEAIARVAGAVPIIIPALPECVDIDEIMGVCGGSRVTGGRPHRPPER